MSKRRIVQFIVLGAATVSLAGFSAYAKRANRAMAADQTISFSGRFDGQQISNSAAKTDRLAIKTAPIAPAAQNNYVLASLQPDMEIERPAHPAIAATGTIPVAQAPPAREKPSDKARRLPPPPAPAATTGLLDDGQISGLKGRLRLTSDQAEFWPPVEAALRDVARTHFRGARHAFGGKLNIDTNSPEIQKLIWAAMPLLMRLRDDQKSEVRKLARVIGLEQVASQI